MRLSRKVPTLEVRYSDWQGYDDLQLLDNFVHSWLPILAKVHFGNSQMLLSIVLRSYRRQRKNVFL